MQLRADQLSAHLAKGALAPVYLLTGDEPLQIQECGDAIRSAAKEQGFGERQVLEADAKYDWSRLGAEADALSLFADKRLFDLRVPGGKLGRDGGAALLNYLERPAPDTLLLVTLPKLERSQRNAKWFNAMANAGIVVSIWPLERAALPSWLQRRGRDQGLALDAEAASFLAAQTEGNLLAAAQEIDKLALLSGGGRVDLPQVAASVSGSARYNVFELADTMLRADVPQALRMLQGLKAEGTAAPVVLWALARELRVLEGVSAALSSGADPAAAIVARGMWKNRQPMLVKAARRLGAADWRRLVAACAQVDRAIKGQEKADPWLLMEDMLSAAMGISIMQGAADLS